jgi:hypothetical protein
MQDTSTPDLSDDDEPLLPSSGPSSLHAPSTPNHNPHSTTEPSSLSPPDSRGVPGLAPASNSKQQQQQQQQSPSSAIPPAEMLNANGKRTLDVATGAPTPGTGPGSGKYLGRHEGGYAWDREEDAPGYAWRNAKAQEEGQRALGQIVDLGVMIKGMYGDILGLE